MSKFDDLVHKLKEIFQIDRPELDFGVYRILNARVVEINDYLENRLKAKVMDSLAATGCESLGGLHHELTQQEGQYLQEGVAPDTVSEINELRYQATPLKHILTHKSKKANKINDLVKIPSR